MTANEIDIFRAAFGRTTQHPALIRMTLDATKRQAATVAGKRRGLLPSLARAVSRMAPGSVTVDGVVDFAGRKAALGNESLSILEKDGQLWTGRPGSSIANVRPAGVPHELAPLALIDLLSTAEDADVIVEQNPEHPHLTRLRLTMPAGTTADAVDVWLDDAYLRRATLDTTDTATSLIIEQLDVDVAGVDWTRLPSSRRPDAR